MPPSTCHTKVFQVQAGITKEFEFYTRIAKHILALPLCLAELNESLSCLLAMSEPNLVSYSTEVKVVSEFIEGGEFINILHVYLICIYTSIIYCARIYWSWQFINIIYIYLIYIVSIYMYIIYYIIASILYFYVLFLYIFNIFSILYFVKHCFSFSRFLLSASSSTPAIASLHIFRI